MSMQRQRRLQHLHGVLANLIMHEGRFVSERTNNFLLYNSIFFAGFLILRTQFQQETGWTIAAGVVISLTCILFSLLHFFVIGQNIAAANFWRSTIGFIERDPDFWRPEKTDDDTDLDFWSAKNRLDRGEKTRQEQHPLKLGGIPIKQRYGRPFFAPNYVFGTWLPLIIGLLWLFAFIWTIGAIN